MMIVIQRTLLMKKVKKNQEKDIAEKKKKVQVQITKKVKMRVMMKKMKIRNY